MYGQVGHEIEFQYSDCIVLVLNLYQTITLHSPLSYRNDIKIGR